MGEGDDKGGYYEINFAFLCANLDCIDEEMSFFVISYARIEAMAIRSGTYTEILITEKRHQVYKFIYELEMFVNVIPIVYPADPLLLLSTLITCDMYNRLHFFFNSTAIYFCDIKIHIIVSC